MVERLQKVLAQAGLGSRRGCEELIREGRVTVNGRTALLGSSVDPQKDEIRVDGERLASPQALTYVLLNKPVGVVSSLQDQAGRHRTVRDLVPLSERVYPVGRLDVDSEGLMLLTNDGDLAYRLTHPRFECEKEYRVLLDRVPTPEQLEVWRRGVVLPEGERTYPAQVRLEADGKRGPWIRVVVHEGRKRQLREVARVLGLNVRRLIRVRLAGLRLGSLRPGEWRVLDRAELTMLEQRPKPGGGAAARRSGHRAARGPRRIPRGAARPRREKTR